jgi:hypothetical protein
MDNDPLPAMLFPLPSGTLLRQARADAPRGKVWTWLQALPQNDWGQALPERVKRLAEACRADRARCGLTPGLPLGTRAFSTLPPEPTRQEA